MPLSICFLIEGPILSPAYFRALGLSNALVQLGHEIIIVCDNRKDNLEKIDEIKKSGINVVSYEAHPKIKSILECRKILGLNKSSWLVQLNPTLRGFFTLFGHNHKVIGEWDEPIIFVPQNLIKKCINYLLHYWFISKSKIHVSCTKAFLKYLPNGIYIPHGQHISQDCMKSIAVDSEEYYAYLGNFYPLFDHDLLFYSLKDAATRNFLPKVVMIGGGPDLQKWKDYAIKHELKNIEFKGYCTVEEFMPILKGARALLFPMRNTKLNCCRCSSKIFAYLASGVPVVAHSIGEIKELLNEVAYLANFDDDLIELLEKKVYKDIKISKLNDHISYDHLAKKYIEIIYNAKF